MYLSVLQTGSLGFVDNVDEAAVIDDRQNRMIKNRTITWDTRILTWKNSAKEKGKKPRASENLHYSRIRLQTAGVYNDSTYQIGRAHV